MSKPGANCLTTIWRMVNYPDDAVGGAQITGSAVYTGVQTRLDPRPTTVWEQLLEAQGYETQRGYTAILVPASLDIRERDEMEITAPVDHKHYGEKFRIISVEYTPLNIRDPRNYVTLTLVRSVRAHTVQ